MTKKPKSKASRKKAAAAVVENHGVALEDAVIAELCERIGPEALAEILANPLAGMGAAGPFSSCSPDACAACPSKSAGCVPQKPLAPEEPVAPQETVVSREAASGETPSVEELLPTLTEEERSAVLALDHKAVSEALSREESVVSTVATEFIMYYSLRVAEALRQGNEFLHVVKPTESTPAVERIAMAIVREAVSESLAQEASGWYDA